LARDNVFAKKNHKIKQTSSQTWSNRKKVSAGTFSIASMREKLKGLNPDQEKRLFYYLLLISLRQGLPVPHVFFAIHETA
jgi:hypothetical protein